MVFPRCLSLLGLLCGLSAWAEAADELLTDQGKQLVRHYDVTDYGAHVNTVGGAMLSDGRVLFGSFGGVVLYGGQSWEFLPVVESFIMDQVVLTDDEIFVSGGGIFGRLVRGENGRYVYESLVDQVVENPEDYVWGSMLVHAGAVWVSTERFMFSWRDGVVQVTKVAEAERDGVRLAAALKPMLASYRMADIREYLANLAEDSRP